MKIKFSCPEEKQNFLDQKKNYIFLTRRKTKFSWPEGKQNCLGQKKQKFLTRRKKQNILVQQENNIYCVFPDPSRVRATIHVSRKEF